jgi:hypothetical protein
MKFKRMEQSLESIEDRETENPREPTSFNINSLTAGERKMDS